MHEDTFRQCSLSFLFSTYGMVYVFYFHILFLINIVLINSNLRIESLAATKTISIYWNVMDEHDVNFYFYQESEVIVFSSKPTTKVKNTFSLLSILMSVVTQTNISRSI